MARANSGSFPDLSQIPFLSRIVGSLVPEAFGLYDRWLVDVGAGSISDTAAFLDNIYLEVKDEVRRSLATMHDFDDAEDPNQRVNIIENPKQTCPWFPTTSFTFLSCLTHSDARDEETGSRPCA